MFLLRLADFLRVLSVKKKSILGLFRKGSSLASTQIFHAIRCQVDQLNTIIDVGANQGQFALAASESYPQSFIYSFEPVPHVFRRLQNNTKRNTRIRHFPFGLGDEDGDINFFENQYSHASSALPLSKVQSELFSNTNSVTATTIAIRKLDTIIDEIEIRSPLLLKLDVQGYEVDVLRGGKGFLKHVDYLLVEVSFVPMYEGELLFDEMHSFIKENGFELMGPVGFLQSSDLQILQMDMLYKKASSKKYKVAK